MSMHDNMQTPAESSMEILSGNQAFSTKRPLWLKLVSVAIVLLLGIALLGKVVWLQKFSHPVITKKGNQSNIVSIIAVRSNMGYGTLVLNSQSMALSEAEYNHIALKAGLNTVQVIVPPFPTRTCTIHYPPTQEDTCWDTDKQGLSLLYFISDLPSNQQGIVSQLVQKKISSIDSQLVTSVPIGNLYAIGQDSLHQTIVSTVAHSPLTAQLKLSLQPSDPNCKNLICAGEPGFDNNEGNWSTAWSYIAYWQFTNANGIQVGQSPPITGTINISLNYLSGYVWSINEKYNPIESSLYEQTCSIQISQVLDTYAQSQQASLSGCIFDFTSNNLSANFLNTDIVYFVRFGVIMAANTQSQEKSPSLPAIPPSEMPFFASLVNG